MRAVAIGTTGEEEQRPESEGKHENRVAVAESVVGSELAPELNRQYEIR